MIFRQKQNPTNGLDTRVKNIDQTAKHDRHLENHCEKLSFYNYSED